jgi:hypothetical protein
MSRNGTEEFVVIFFMEFNYKVTKFTNKTDRHNIAEQLLKVALNTITLTFAWNENDIIHTRDTRVYFFLQTSCVFHSFEETAVLEENHRPVASQ